MINILLIGDGSPAITTLYEQWTAGSELSGIFCVLAPPLSDTLSLGVRTLREFTTVVLMPSNVTPAPSDELQGSLREYVSQGGTLICLPFTAWSAAFHRLAILDDLLPVSSTGYREGLQIELHAEKSRLIASPAKPPLAERVPPSSVCDGPYTLSAEILEPRLDAQIDSEFVAAGIRYPLAVLHNVGRGHVLYFNACHHPAEGPECIWSAIKQDGTPGTGLSRLLFDYGMAIWRESGYRGSAMPEFVARMAALMDDTPTYVRDDRPGAEFVEAMWVHYGSLDDARSLLFPQIAEYAALPQLSRIILCRALWTITELLWRREFAPAEVVAAIHDYDAFGMGDVSALLEPTPQNKGALLESLAVYTLLLIPGIDLVGRNVRTSTGELDAVLAASPSAVAELWPGFPETFAIECKNWQAPVSALQIRDFKGKLDDLGLRLGVIFCRAGPTGSRHRDATALLRDYRQNGQHILAITSDDLRLALRSLSPVALLRQAYRSLVVL
jgi:hypothetical protein